MHSSLCDEVCAWVATGTGTPSPALCVHVADCERCQAALLLLTAQLFGAPLAAESITCAACQEDLPAYIDLERAEGAQAALHAYPHVWWHLWVCADCAETCALTVALLDAVAEGSLSPLPLVQATSPPAHPAHLQIRLPHAWFAHVLVPAASPVGAAWGDEGETILHESEADGYQFSVSVQQANNRSWYAIVSLTPPFSGTVVLTLGALTLRTPLDPDGRAMVGPIPTALLNTPTGPDMTIAIETTDD